LGERRKLIGGGGFGSDLSDSEARQSGFGHNGAKAYPGQHSLAHGPERSGYLVPLGAPTFGDAA
jgi:hypothetical protein